MIGVFGGSFNPIHIGHLIVAEFIREEFKLEKVVFVPAKKPPHKDDHDMENAQHRYNMVGIATENNPFFAVSNLELNREGFSYTADTLMEMKLQNPVKKLFFICGKDSMTNLTTWHNIGKIFKCADVIVAGRSNVSDVDFKKMVRWFSDQYNARIHCSRMPSIDLSSTEIRDRIQKGISVRYMVPEEVLGYIQLHRLY